MKLRILSGALVLCLCISSPSVVYAYEEESSLQEGNLTEEIPEEISEEITEESDTGDDVITVYEEESLPQEDVLMEEDADAPDISDNMITALQEDLLQQENVFIYESTDEPVAHDSTVPAPAEAYEAMIALKDQDMFKEGTVWNDYEPYSDSNLYRWHGGTLGGTNIVAVGCVAFAFRLSDEAFGDLPARMYASGEFSFEDIKVGDILRVSNDAHTVIVIEALDAGVVVAEGNNSGKVHWGRVISREEVMNNTSHYITRYPAGYVSPDDPEADVSIASGTLDGGLTWNLTNAGTLTILGEGAMPDFDSVASRPWNNNSSEIRKVIIGDGVTSVGSCAFWNCGVLSVEISSSVTAIGSSAFYGSPIVSVSIPSSVKTIGDGAFGQCKNLSSVTVSEGVETIGQNVFRSCTNLTSIALPASIREVGDAAFFECTAMRSAAFAPGSSQVKLGDNLFSRCYYLTNVTLPLTIDRIGEGMFQNCLLLARVEIPQGAESIGGSAFASCSSLTAVVIPDSVTTIGIAAFSDSALSDIYFTGTEAQWSSISKIGDTASAVSKATIHYNYIPVTSPGSDADSGDSSGNNTGSSLKDEAGSDSMTSSAMDSDMRAIMETWKPTTPDEIKRYACMGKEAVQYTLPKENVCQIVVENAMQGPMCFQSFEAVLGDYTIGRTYNIYSLSDAVSDTIYSMDEEIQFTIKIPLDIYRKDREYKMICVTKGGQPIIYNDSDSNPETITVKTDKFYAYALIYK